MAGSQGRGGFSGGGRGFAGRGGYDYGNGGQRGGRGGYRYDNFQQGEGGGGYGCVPTKCTISSLDLQSSVGSLLST